MTALGKLIYAQFIQRSAVAILFISITISCTEFLFLFLAARSDDGLIIPGGVGLLNNYGIFSVLIGDAFLLYISKKLVDNVMSADKLLYVEKRNIIKKDMLEYKSIICLQTKHKFALFLFIFVGVAAGFSNITIHVFGHAETHWNAVVFDSTEHMMSFIVNKINTLYSWVFTIPVCVYSILASSLHLHSIIRRPPLSKLLKYDLLHPDRCGGFSFVGKAQVYYNLAIAILYIQITLHVITFATVNIEYILSYATATVAFFFGNTLFSSLIYPRIEELRLDAFRECKENITNGNSLNFEIYKYCHDKFTKMPYAKGTMVVVNAIRALSIAVPPLVKFIGHFILSS